MPILSRMIQSLVLILLMSAPAVAQTVFMDIRPFSGIGQLTLGMSMDEVQNQVGEPDEASSVNEALAGVSDLSRSTYGLTRFDTEWKYTKKGAPFYNLLFNDGRLVFIMCTYNRMGENKLALDGKSLPPLTTEVVKELFGEPNEIKQLGHAEEMMYYKSPYGMAFAHAGPGQKPVGMLMFGSPSKQEPSKQTQAPARQTCLRQGEIIDDPLDYVARYYRCKNLASVGELALPASTARLWKRAEESGFIDQPFSIMGNDYKISDLSVVKHALKSFNPHSIELTVRASFRNFGEMQTVDWVFQDDLNDELPMTLVDIRGVSPHEYSMIDYLRSVAQ